MIYVGMPYKIYYAALNYTSGLSDINVYIINPSGETEGPFLMTEVDNSGIYVYEYIPTQVGIYLMIADSISLPNKFSKSLEVVMQPSPIPVADFD